MSRPTKKREGKVHLNLLHAKRSLMLYFDGTALITPKGRPKRIEKNKDKAASFAVIGILGPISSIAGISDTKEKPRSPTSSALIQSKYCW